MRNFKEDLQNLLGDVNLTTTTLRFPLFYEKEFEEIPVDRLELNGRAVNVLKQNKIFKLADVMEKWDEFATFRQCGIGTVREVKGKFMQLFYEQLDPAGVERFWKGFAKENFA